MDYIRDHCKAIAFDILKARADPMSDDPYVTSKEMVEELHSMFGEYDKLTKCDVELHDPAFAMGMGFKRKNEIFDEFYARFSATVALLGYSETHKISALKRLITPRLRLQIIDGTISSYRQYVERLRRCDQNMRVWGDVEEIDEREFLATTPHTIHRDEYSEDFKAKLKKDGRCFKCLGYGHRPNQTDAPCVGSTPLSFEQAKAILAKEKEKAFEKD